MSINLSVSDLQTLSNYHGAIQTYRTIRVHYGNGSVNFYKPISLLLGIKTENGRSSFVTINRTDVNCFNLFLSLFGYGVLAHTQFHLKEIAAYLERVDLTDIKKNPEKKAFKTICAIANRWARHSNRIDEATTLMDSISTDQKIKNFTFKVNPETEVRDLGTQIRRDITKTESQLIHNLTHNLPGAVYDPLISQLNLAFYNLDKDSDVRRSAPITKIKLNDGSILNSHALIEKNVKEIDKIQIISRISAFETDAVEAANRFYPDLFEISHEEYHRLSLEEEERLTESLYDTYAAAQ